MSGSENPLVRVFGSREEMGHAAAGEVSRAMLALLEEEEKVRMIFAAAPSQNEFLAHLVQSTAIPWKRVEAFHMDEYLMIGHNAPQSFGRFLREKLFDRVPVGRVEYIDPAPRDPEAECQRYEALLHEEPIDIVCMGIGENGHIAFNDPPVADFSDPLSVKIVELDTRCREQQVHDGSYAKLEDVPHRAITLTVPELLSAKRVFVVVPGLRKAAPVFAALRGPIATSCPASSLRTHPAAEFFLDADAASLLR